MHALLAVGVNADGHREILGLQVSSVRTAGGWLGFFRDLTARGLSGVRLVTSDAHAGLVAAIGATLPGASWQRCRTHYAANLMAVTPKTSGLGSRRCCTASTTSPTRRRCMPSSTPVGCGGGQAAEGRGIWTRPRRRPGLHRLPEGGLAADLEQQPQERLNGEIRRRTDVVGIFPDRASLVRLVGAVLAEQDDEWAEGRRYLGLDLLGRCRLTLLSGRAYSPRRPWLRPRRR